MKKTKEKSQITIIFTILGVLMLLFGKELGSILQLLICLAIIINSIDEFVLIYREYKLKKQDKNYEK